MTISTMTPQHQQTCQEILTLIEMAQGFELVFIECNAPALQQTLENELENRSPHKRWLKLRFERAIRNVREELIERQLPLDADAILSIRGLEHSIQTDNQAAEVVARLNVARDILPRSIPCPLLLWLPLYALHNFARFAPDLWSWRTGVFHFESLVEEGQKISLERPVQSPIEGGRGVSNYSKAFKEGEIEFLTPIVEAFDTANASPHELQKNAENTYQLAEFHYSLSNFKEALSLFKRVSAYYQRIGDNKRVAYCHHYIGMIYADQGEYDNALHEYQASLQIVEELGDKLEIAAIRHQLGIIHQQRGDYAAALREYQASLLINEEIGNKSGIATTRHQLGMIHQARGDYAAALSEYQASLLIREEIGNKSDIASTRHQFGNIHYLRGDYDAAWREYQASLLIREEIEDKSGVALTHGQLGNIHSARGDYEAALREYQIVLNISEELGDKSTIAITYNQLGLIHEAREEYPQAFQEYFQAFTLFAQLQSPHARIVFNNLWQLRQKWGAAAFDAAWQAATGQAVPEELKELQG